MIDFGTTGYVWLDVEKITPARDRTYDEVKDRVKTDWIAVESGKLVQAKADELKARLEKGADMAGIAREVGLELATTELLKRTDSHNLLNADAIRQGFSGKSGAVTIVDGVDGSMKILIQIAEVKQAEGGANTLSEDEKTRMNAAASNDLMQQLIENLRTAYGASINRNNIEAALSQI